MNREKREYFRSKLLMHRDQMREMVQRNEEHGRQREDAGMDSADLAVASYSREVMFGMSSADRQKLRQIGEALIRLANDSYGVCAGCEEEIFMRRLEAVPWAEYCVACQAQLEKKNINGNGNGHDRARAAG